MEREGDAKGPKERGIRGIVNASGGEEQAVGQVGTRGPILGDRPDGW